jgi:hypothetical protein
MSFAEMKAFAVDQVICDYCSALPGEKCTTRTGGRARYVHRTRLWAVQKAWSLGYADATVDMARSYVNEPEWFDRYARREVERTAS